MLPSITPRYILNVINRHKCKIIITFLSTLITATIGTYRATPTYETATSLLVKFGREYLYAPEIDERKVPYNYFNPAGVINTEIQIVTSLELAEQLITTVGIENIYPSSPQKKSGIKDAVFRLATPFLASIGLKKNPSSKKDTDQKDQPNQDRLTKAAAMRLHNSIVVRGDTTANVIHITFTHSDPQIAANVLNTLVDLYIEKHTQMFSIPLSSVFFEKQVDSYYKKFKTLQKKLESFQKENFIFQPNKQQELLLEQRANLQNILFLNESEMLNNNRFFFEDPERNQVIIDGKKTLLNLKLKEENLRERYKKEGENTKSIKRQISLLEQLLKEIPDKKKEYLSKNKKIKEQIKKIDKSLLELALKEVEFRKLQSEIEVTEKNYQKYRNKLEDALISNEMDQQELHNIKVLTKAPVPLGPILPRKKMNIATGAIIGIILGFGIAFCFEYIEYLRQRTNSSEPDENNLS